MPHFTSLWFIFLNQNTQKAVLVLRRLRVTVQKKTNEYNYMISLSTVQVLYGG